MSPVATAKPKPPKPDHFDPNLGVFVDKEGVPIPKREGTRPHPVSRADFKLDTRSVYTKDQAILGPIVHLDENGYPVQNAGAKALKVKPRKLYRRGARFRVVAENVRIEAMCHYGNGSNGGAIWSGWSRVLPIGTEIECLGWRRFRRDGLVAPQFTYSELPAEAKWSTIWPLDGVWRPWPLAGMIELIDPKEVQS